MTVKACQPEKQKYWQLLAEGLFRGQPLLSLLRSIEQVLPRKPMGQAVQHSPTISSRGQRFPKR